MRGTEGGRKINNKKMSSSSPTGQIASAADIKQENGMESASEGQEAPEKSGGGRGGGGAEPPAPAPFPLEPGDAAAAAAGVSGEGGAVAAAAGAAVDQVQLHSGTSEPGTTTPRPPPPRRPHWPSRPTMSPACARRCSRATWTAWPGSCGPCPRATCYVATRAC